MKKLFNLLNQTEEELKLQLYKYLIQKKMSPVFEEQFIYAKGNIPILLVAHMDTVFNEPPKNLYYDRNLDEIFSINGGIGADDRCGVYAIVKILERLKPHVLFTQGEEIGGIGAKEAVARLIKPDVKYIIEFDRRGNNDCVFYDCGNQEFIDYIESFGFVRKDGIFSDISILGIAWDIAAVNLSCGYYNEHTNLEYIKFKELKNNIRRVKSMLQEYKQAKNFDYQEITYISHSCESIYCDLSSEEDVLCLKYLEDSSVQKNNEKRLVLEKKHIPENKNGGKYENG